MGNVLSSASAAVAVDVPLWKPPCRTLPWSPPLLTALALRLDWWHLSRCSNKNDTAAAVAAFAAFAAFAALAATTYALTFYYVGICFLFCLLPWRFFNFF